MSYLFFEYPKCSTCQKAKKFLKENKIEFTAIHIVNHPPTAETLRLFHLESGLPIEKFFNTSGKVYQNLNLKELLPTLSLDEKYQLLSSDGMLIKRPLFVGENQILLGFKEQAYTKITIQPK